MASPPALSARDDAAYPGAGVRLGGHHRKKGRKGTAAQGKRNIFMEWGMDSDARAMKEVNIGGVVIKRSDVSRFWQSDTDLRRWQRGLADSSRNTKLLVGVRARYHEDINADFADLRQNHSSFRRQRNLAPIEEAKGNAALEMRELWQRLKPPEEVKKGKRAAFGSMDFSGLLGGIKKSDGLPDAAGAAADMQQATAALGRLLEWLYVEHGSLEAAFAKIDANGDGEVCLREFTRACAAMGYRSDVGCLMRVLDKSSDGSLSKAEFMNLKPYMPKSSPAASSRGAPGTDAGEEEAEEPESREPSKIRSVAPKAALPSAPPKVRCASLLVFLNADAHHPGQPVLLRPWPPVDLASVLRACDAQSLRCLVGPATGLFGRDLRPVRSVEALVPGGMYVIRGQEALDPPHSFLHLAAAAAQGSSDHGGVGSLQAVTRASHAFAAERASGGPGRPPAVGHESAPSLWPEEPPAPAGGPPRGRQRQPQGEKWKPDDSLGFYLTHGGLGQLPQHHHYHSWPRASRRGPAAPRSPPSGAALLPGSRGSHASSSPSLQRPPP